MSIYPLNANKYLINLPVSADAHALASAKSHCSMTFCFSFDFLIELNPILVNIRGGGPS